MSKTKRPNTLTFTFIPLREFPYDVQDILKDRAVKECRPIEDIIHDYIIETSRLILQTSNAA